MIWLGLAMLVLGVIGACVVFFYNSSTPLQLGPVPFFGACALAFVGLIIVIVKVVE